MKDFAKIPPLVGDVTAEQLIYVDYAVIDTLGIFMPVAGQCRYAITPEHTHPAWSFIVSFDSRGRVRIGEKIFDPIPSTVFVIPPKLPHQELPADTVARYIAVMIDPAYLQTQLKAYHLSLNALSCAMTSPITQRLVDALKEFMTDYEEAAPGYRQLLEAGGMKIVHLLIRSLFNLQPGDDAIRYRMSITRAIGYLNGHYGEKITVEDLARVANLSPSRFSHVFKEETAMSPMEYIMQTRLDCSKRMLRSNEKTLSQIALDCGFNSSSYFYHCFSRAFSISPSDYRKSFSIAE